MIDLNSSYFNKYQMIVTKQETLTAKVGGELQT